MRWSPPCYAKFQRGFGQALAGLLGFISGITVVIPRAGLKSAKIGSVAMSTSPSFMPKFSFSMRICPLSVLFL